MTGKKYWGEISNRPSPRMSILSEYIKSPNEFKTYSAIPESLSEVFKLASSEVKSLRVAPEFMDKLEFIITQNYTDISVVNSVDSLFYDEKDGWWPDCIFKEVIYQFLTQNMKDLDVTHPALIIGSGGLSRSTIAGLVKLGIKHINICDFDVERAQKIVSDFKKTFFQTNFSFIEKDDRTSLPGVHSVVVNTLDFVEHDEFLNELYYFNFLRKGGVVIDLAETPIETPFLRIAKDIHATTYVGYQLWCLFDLFWVQKFFHQPFDIKAYETAVQLHLEKQPINQDVMKKIFEEFQVRT